MYVCIYVYVYTYVNCFCLPFLISTALIITKEQNMYVQSVGSTGFTLNPIQKGHPTRYISFLPVTSTNVGISPQNLLTFSLNPFATLG